MSVSLNAAEVQALKKAGFSAAQIRAYQLNKADDVSRHNILSTLQNSSGTKTSIPSSVFGGAGTSMGGAPGAGNSGPYGGLPNSSPPASGSSGPYGQVPPHLTVPGLSPVTNSGPSHGAYGTYFSYPEYAAQTRPSPFDYTKSIGGDKGSGDFVKGNASRYNSFGGAFGTPEGDYKHPFPEGYVPFTPGGKGDNAGSDTTVADPGTTAGPAIPDPAPINVPVITPHDFTPQATKLADTVFKPLFDQLSASKTNIGEQGKQNRQVLTGLYSGMVNDIAKSAAESAAQSTAQKADVGQRGQALQQDIGGGYQSSNQDTAALAKSLGVEAAAPDVLQQGAADEAWQKSMAAQGTNAMQNYVGEQAQSEANLNTARQDTARTSGQVAQEGNLKDVANALAGVDAQTAGYQSDKARTAIDIGQNLSSQDLSAQGTNAGLSMQGQGMNQDAIWKAFQAAQHQTDSANQTAQQNADRQQQGIQFDWKKQMDQANLDLETAKANATASGKAGGAIDPGNYVGPAKGLVSLANTYGDKGRSLGNLAQQVFTTSDASNTGNMNQFTSDMFAAGHAAGYSDIELRDAAQTMFPLLFQKQGP